MGLGKAFSGIQKDAVSLMFGTLTVVMIIVILDRAGGFAEVGRVLFGGWNATLATLLGRPAERV